MAANKSETEGVILLFFLSIVTGAIGIVIYFVFFRKSEVTEDNEIKKELESKPVKKQQDIKKKAPPQPNKKDAALNHQLHLATLKGHTATITDIDFSSNGKYLASCSEDRTARFWHVNDFSSKEHKYARFNIEFGHASSISVSPDSKAFIVSLGNAKTLRVYKVQKNKNETTGNTSLVASHEYDFPKVHTAEVVDSGIASNGKFVMSAAANTELIIWNLKGEVYEKIDTLLIHNTQAAISPCGNLVAVCGFTSDVKLWQVCFSKNGEFTKVCRALELKGHSAGVHSFSFSNDSHRMATVSKDGTWRLWDIEVEYTKGQDAYLLQTGSYTTNELHASTIALSHDHLTVAVATNTTLAFYNTKSGELEEEVQNAHKEPVTQLQWHSDSRQLVSVGERMIRVWHNAPGARASLVDLEEKLPRAKSEAMKERIKTQIKETRAYLKNFE